MMALHLGLWSARTMKCFEWMHQVNFESCKTTSKQRMEKAIKLSPICYSSLLIEWAAAGKLLYYCYTLRCEFSVLLCSCSSSLILFRDVCVMTTCGNARAHKWEVTNRRCCAFQHLKWQRQNQQYRLTLNIPLQACRVNLWGCFIGFGVFFVC